MQKHLKMLLAAIAAFGLAAAVPAFAQKAEAPKQPAAAKKAEARKAVAKKEEAKKEEMKSAPAGLMDINTASEAELASLKGIGPVRAKAIVKGRPYKGKDDLVRRKIVPQNVYDDIREQVIAKQ